MAIDILQMAVVLAVAMLIVVPFGWYMAAVFTGGRTWIDPIINPIDTLIYRFCGVRQDQGMRWPAYVKAMLVTNLVMMLFIFGILETQQLAPLNPDHQGFVNPFLAFNTAASFITNTNWQNYSGESTLSYFSQLFAIIFPMFTSAATGLACGVAFIRGLAGKVDLGNFYVDLTRIITRILLPICFVAAVLFVGLGVPQTFSGAAHASMLNGPLAHPASTTSPVAPGRQVIARGPVAALETIKHLGTNGGGFFGANSAHPFENPSPITNVLEMLLMLSIPTSLIYTLGIMIDRKKQAWTLFAVMAGFFLV
ncbi:MAG: potassium-transporting ATPase subunit KdpA, partial [Chloroflexota bacterium]